MTFLRLLGVFTVSAIVLGAASEMIATVQAAEPEQMLVYFGTYTKGKSKGIYVSRINLVDGSLSEPELAAEAVNPSFLAIAPNRKFMYAVGEIDDFNGKKTGAVNAYAINASTGKLTLLNQQSSEGTGPAHIAVDKTGKVVLVANYGGGSVTALPILADGKLGEATAKIQHTGSSVNLARQKEPHAHSFNVSADDRFAFAADLGLDKIFIYKLDAAKGTLTPNDPAFGVVKPGSGPRHFAFHPNGKFAYVINEITCTLTAFDYDAKRGALSEIETVSTLPPGDPMKPSYSTAEVQVHPTGRFVYGSNRGHNTIVVYSVDQKTGKLTWVENQSTQGKTPRNFGIDPGGRFLLAANQDSDDVYVYRIDATTGKLTPTGASVKVGMPVCVKFLLPRGVFVF